MLPRYTTPLFALALIGVPAADACAVELYLTYNGERGLYTTNGNPVGGYGAMPVGDFNGDGHEDLAVSKGAMGWQEDWVGSTWLIHLGGPSPAEEPNVILQFSGRQGGTLHAVGDLNGDGFDDLAGSRWSSPMSLYIFRGGESSESFPEPSLRLEDAFGSRQFNFGDQIAVGDFDANGVTELIVADPHGEESDNGHIYTFELSAEVWSAGMTIGPTSQVDGPIGDRHFSEHLVPLGDCDGNGSPDLLVALEEGILFVFYGGPLFDFNSGTPADGYLLGDPIGDLNGDDVTDFYYEGDIYFGGGLFGKSPDVVAPEIVSYERSLGDFDGDGFNDMVTAVPEGDGHRIYMLFGGPSMDGYVDAEFYHDGGMNCRPMGRSQPNCVTAAGDFNHDGKDDIAIVDETVVHPDDEPPLNDPMGQVWIYSNVANPVSVLQVILNATPSAGGVLLNWSVPTGTTVDRLEIWRLTEKYGSTMVHSLDGPELGTAGSFTDTEVIGTYSSYKVRAEVRGSIVESNEAIVAGVPRHPATLSISAHPNPFNPQTSIQFSVPQAAHVSVSVYNAMGRLVTTLLDEPMNAGTHSVNWAGQDRAGNTVASGAYTVVVESDGRREQIRIALLK